MINEKMNINLTNIKCSQCGEKQATHQVPMMSKLKDEDNFGITTHYEYFCDECWREYELKMKYKNLD